MEKTVYEACKNRKRTPTIFSINSFVSPGSPMELHGPFRENIRLLLEECAETEDYSVAGNPVWCNFFISDINGVVFPLYTIEEDVKNSSLPLCDFCRSVGWSHHFVSKRRYHFIIPQDTKWTMPLNEDSLMLSEHLLHGVIHCNGFGHLLCINGIEEGSKCFSGVEIMEFWDRLCTILQTRKISVHDESKKGSMDLRLLYGVAYGRPWFSKWGYKFSHGSFGVTEQKYNRAIQILSSLDLEKINHDFIDTSQGKVIQQIIHCYKDASETQLVTISDLLQFMLVFKSKAPIQRKTTLELSAISSKSTTKTTQEHKIPTQDSPIKHSTYPYFVSKSDSRYPARRLNYAVEVIAKILEGHRGRMISRNDLRDAARVQIGDTGLIDFVLKSVDKITIGNQIIRRSINPVTKKLEFSLQKVANKEDIRSKTELPGATLALEPGLDVYEDMLFLYKVLLSYPESDSILDSKHFVKEWHLKGNEEDTFLRLICQVMPSYDELVTKLTRALPPGELVVVPRYVTFGELKLVVQCTLRDTYCIMENFIAKGIRIGGELEGREEDQVLMSPEEMGAEVWVRGCGLDLGTTLRYEGGAENWTVDCGCGAKDDDGEKMVACDKCEVWQHTRCNRIGDDEDVPFVFLCGKCR